mgnify:CR=1 FL=1
MKEVPSVYTVSVPVWCFIDAIQNNYSRKLQFFILLKLVYPEGKSKLTARELSFLELTDGIGRKTTEKYLQFFIKKSWIYYNPKTQYYILKSFDRIRKENKWQNRLAFPVGYHNYQQVKAVTGAVLYSYLHRGFWRRLAKRKSVQIMGSTYNFPHSKFNFKRKPAPVSVSWISNFFGISQASASLLKSEAENIHLLKVKKNYGTLIADKINMLKSLKYDESKPNIVWHKGHYRFQLIDTIYPLFYFTKRKSIKA